MIRYGRDLSKFSKRQTIAHSLFNLNYGDKVGHPDLTRIIRKSKYKDIVKRVPKIKSGEYAANGIRKSKYEQHFKKKDNLSYLASGNPNKKMSKNIAFHELGHDIDNRLRHKTNAVTSRAIARAHRVTAINPELVKGAKVRMERKIANKNPLSKFLARRKINKRLSDFPGKLVLSAEDRANKIGRDLAHTSGGLRGKLDFMVRGEFPNRLSYSGSAKRHRKALHNLLKSVEKEK